jgi:hypothetical protein
MQSPRRTVLIVGGGGMVEAVRDWDRAHGLAPSDAHWLAIDAMSMTSRLAAYLLPEANWTDDWTVLNSCIDTLKRELQGGLLIFDPRRFLRDIEPTAAGTPLPQSWDVTSDSIAARIADLLGSEELVLLKSRLPEARPATLDEMAAAGFVDRGFPTFAPRLPLVRLVNLRGNAFPEARFEQSDERIREGAGVDPERPVSACDHSPLTTQPASDKLGAECDAGST